MTAAEYSVAAVCGCQLSSLKDCYGSIAASNDWQFSTRLLLAPFRPVARTSLLGF